MKVGLISITLLEHEGENSLVKKKVQVERKKWENIITSDKSTTFF